MAEDQASTSKAAATTTKHGGRRHHGDGDNDNVEDGSPSDKKLEHMFQLQAEQQQSIPDLDAYGGDSDREAEPPVAAAEAGMRRSSNASSAVSSPKTAPAYELPTAYRYYQTMPKRPVAPLASNEHFDFFEEATGYPQLWSRMISTYPIVTNRKTGKKAREGDPIADQIAGLVYQNRVVLAVADGCNWGPRPYKAAHDASRGLIAYMEKQFTAEFESQDNTQTKDTSEIGRLLLLGLHEANKKITEDLLDVWEAGTTTLLSCCICKLADSDGWAVMLASVGDCKGFIWNKGSGTLHELTISSRAMDLKDPGGRLGPYVGDGLPDLRNLQLYFQPCQEGDIVLLTTDGMYDNLDPAMLGRTPDSLGLDNKASWNDIDGDLVCEAKNKFRLKKLKDLMKKKEWNPQNLIETLMTHAWETTTNVREFMSTQPGACQPKNHKDYPGKMDHTSAVAFCVGEVDVEAVSAQCTTSSPAASV
eukprot:TRINITY_DN5069_c0_g1_i1.p1 TRINITY_DN5069_c0_g1~~TRINITY_DN5069_c0_g1_i1.p1  ORF type:complete len:484 (+),score=134.25 TRINITY_DN5069_c0_g1_i1:28-1452(+)